MKKYISETSEGYSLVDNYTGEIKELKVRRVLTIDEFILVFLKSIPDLMKLDGKPLKLLLVCWKRCSFNPDNAEEGNIISNNALFKKAVREAGLDLTDAGIDSYMSRLAKQGFLIKQCHGSYMLNPKYFFRGRVNDAAKLQLTLETEE